jgi:hypothetical protein
MSRARQSLHAQRERPVPPADKGGMAILDGHPAPAGARAAPPGYEALSAGAGRCRACG